MPRRKIKKTPKRVAQNKRRPAKPVQKQDMTFAKLTKMVQSVTWSESYTSLLMGIVVVIVGALFVVSYLRQTHHVQETTSIATTATPTPQKSALQPEEKTYTVQKGDDLWHIAEKFYKSGYNWVDIARANNLANPGVIHVGNVLVIPNATPKMATISQPATTPAMQAAPAITGTTYTVQKGDDLWHIAVRAYADGYQWTKIARANNLANPGMIYSGNVLKIPR